MRTRNRLLALKKWTFETVCKGRSMKAPGPGMDYSQIYRQEPKTFLGFSPTRPDRGNLWAADPLSTVPGVLIMPLGGNIRNMEEKRFDRYSGIRRPQEFGQSFQVAVQFSVYEPGIRLPGFAAEGQIQPEKILEGTEEGILTLCDWMDDFKDRLLAARVIPDTDLILDPTTGIYTPLQDGGYVVDKRPIYYGFVNVGFQCYADDITGDILDNFLK